MISTWSEESTILYDKYICPFNNDHKLPGEETYKNHNQKCIDKKVKEEYYYFYCKIRYLARKKILFHMRIKA